MPRRQPGALLNWSAPAAKLLILPVLKPTASLNLVFSLFLQSFFSLTLFVTFGFPHWLKRAVFSIPLSSVKKPFGETSGQPCVFVMCLLANVINYDHAGVLEWSAPAAKFNSDAADFSTFFASSLVFLLSLRVSALTLCVPSTPCKKSCLFYFF